MATVTPQPSLADPDDASRDPRYLVIYDGHCRFCIKQVERLARWDRRAELAFLSLHDPRVAERYPDLTHEQLMQDMYLVDRAGQTFRGAAALRRLSCVLPRLWPLAPLLNFPGTLPLWQGLYRLVAQRRYRLGQTCRDDQCQL